MDVARPHPERVPIHVCIIAWPQTNEAAMQIAAGLSMHAEQLTVIYSTADESPLQGAGEWVQVSNACFYGAKHEAGLRRHRRGVFLQIHADATCEDWPGLLARCRDVHSRHRFVGVWSADVEYTPYPTAAVTLLKTNDPHLRAVTFSDAIVWSLAPQVVARLLLLDYQANKYGWGIDVAAAAHAYSNGMVVVRDTAVRVHHPSSRGYSANEAGAQMQRFLHQLTLPEAALAILLRSHFQLVQRSGSSSMPGEAGSLSAHTSLPAAAKS